jgi:hypothetical protein
MTLDAAYTEQFDKSYTLVYGGNGITHLYNQYS